MLDDEESVDFAVKLAAEKGLALLSAALIGCEKPPAGSSFTFEF